MATVTTSKPFTIAEARAARWTRNSLSHAVHVGRLNRLRRGVYQAADDRRADGSADAHDADGAAEARRDHVARTLAAILRNPTAIASHVSAAMLWGLPTLTIPDVPRLTREPGAAGRVSEAHLHRATLPPHHVHTLPGDRRIRLTAPARTAVDVARMDGLAAGLVVADAALHDQLTDERALEASVRACRGWRGSRSAKSLLNLVDSRSESALESISRLKLCDHGIEQPELQPVVLDRNGWTIARVDFYWDRFGVVGEADGLEKYNCDFARLAAEKRRQERLEECGLIVVRCGWRDLRMIDRLVDRLRSAFARGSQITASRAWSTRLGAFCRAGGRIMSQRSPRCLPWTGQHAGPTPLTQAKQA